MASALCVLVEVLLNKGGVNSFFLERGWLNNLQLTSFKKQYYCITTNFILNSCLPGIGVNNSEFTLEMQQINAFSLKFDACPVDSALQALSLRCIKIVVHMH